MGSQSQVEQHVQDSCPAAEVQCSFPGCHARVQRRLLATHVGQCEVGRQLAAAEAERARAERAAVRAERDAAAERAAAVELDAAALRLVRRQRVSLQVTGGRGGGVCFVIVLDGVDGCGCAVLAYFWCILPTFRGV